MRKNTTLSLSISLMLLMILISSITFGQSTNYRIKIGNVEVIALSDGTIPIDAKELFASKGAESISQRLEGAFLANPVEVSINVYLIKDQSRLILVDVGSGTLFGDYGGKLIEALKDVGIQPEEITDVLLTHIHGDHSGGLVVDEKIVFPNAAIHVSEVEVDYWLDEENKEAADPEAMGANPQTFQSAQEMLIPYLKAEQVKTFGEGETEILPNVQAVSHPGHTPGHTVFVLNSNGENLYFWGDLVHVAGIQFSDPALPDHFDVDTQGGILGRENFYSEAAANEYLIAGAHLSFPGFGHLKKVGKKYSWFPVPFSLEGRVK